MKKQKVFVIGGPTACGKSNLALRLAEHLNGSIVNGDAIQVYQDLTVLSARPTEKEMRQIPHYLYGEVDAWSTGSLSDWLQRIQTVVPTLENPIVVGGTGLYLDALINGISPIPDVTPDIRQKVRQLSLEEVRRNVRECPFSDPQRMRRAYEVQLSTGKPLSYFYTLPKKKVIDADFQLIHVLPPRDDVYARCDRRFDEMLRQGAIEEVRHLMKINATGGVLKAIGLREIRAYLLHELSREEMRQKAMTVTRQYAKRQFTWFRHHGPSAHLVEDVLKVNFQDITK